MPIGSRVILKVGTCELGSYTKDVYGETCLRKTACFGNIKKLKWDIEHLAPLCTMQIVENWRNINEGLKNVWQVGHISPFLWIKIAKRVNICPN